MVCVCVGGGVCEAQCSPSHPGFEGFPKFYTFRVVLVPTRGERGSIQFIVGLPRKTKVILVSRSDVPITTHTNVQLGPETTAALISWKIGAFHHHG
jgi:hypothetical protein